MGYAKWKDWTDANTKKAEKLTDEFVSERRISRIVEMAVDDIEDVFSLRKERKGLMYGEVELDMTMWLKRDCDDPGWEPDTELIDIDEDGNEVPVEDEGKRLCAVCFGGASLINRGIVDWDEELDGNEEWYWQNPAVREELSPAAKKVVIINEIRSGQWSDAFRTATPDVFKPKNFKWNGIWTHPRGEALMNYRMFLDVNPREQKIDELLDEMDGFLMEYWNGPEFLSHVCGHVGRMHDLTHEEADRNPFGNRNWFAPDDELIPVGVKFYREEVIPFLRKLEA